MCFVGYLFKDFSQPLLDQTDDHQIALTIKRMKNTGNPLCLEEQQFISSNRPSRSARFTKYSFTSMRLCRIVSLSLVLWTTLPQILRSKNTALECKAFAWTAPTALTTQAERQISFTNERYRQNRIKETSLNDFSSKSALQQVEALKNRIEAEELLGKEDKQIKPDGANGMFKSKIKIGSVVPQAKGLPVNKQQLEAALANLEDDSKSILIVELRCIPILFIPAILTVAIYSG